MKGTISDDKLVVKWILVNNRVYKIDELSDEYMNRLFMSVIKIVNMSECRYN